jgi:hypothetical protein
MLSASLVIVGVNVAVSVISSASSAAMFSTINVMQMFVGLPLTNVEFSKTTEDTMTGFSPIALSFDFSNPGYDRRNLRMLSYDQKDSRLEKIGMKSGSSFVNLLPLIIIFLIIVAIHILITLFCHLLWESQTWLEKL